MRKLINRLKQTWNAERQKVLFSIAIALLIWGMWLAAFGPFLRAQVASSWLSSNPVLGQREEITSGQQPESVAFAGNIPCTTTKFKLKLATLPSQTNETAQACAVMTPQGKTAPGGFTNVFKTDARLFNANGGSANFYPIPGQESGLLLESTALGTKVHYYSTGVLGARKEFNPLTREMKVYLPANPSWTLKDASGKVIYIRPESIAFSNNGQWMVADSEHLASLRVNLLNASVLPFSAPYVYHIGLSVMPQFAISDDGKTVVATSDRGDFRVIDVSSCAPAPPIITGPVACNTTSHESYLRSQISGYYRIYQPRFASDRRLVIYASYNTSPTTRALAKFRMAPSGEVLDNQDYLALGDSFASGEGAYDYFPETDTEANKCHLSKLSYPYLIGQQLSLNSYNSVACSGAKIQDITTFVQKQKIPSPNNMGHWLPGYQQQIQYVRRQNPGILTTGVGGNDAGLMTKMRACFKPGTCYQSYEDRLEIVREINSQFPKLVDLFAQLKKETKVTTKHYAIGYPRVAKEGGACGINVLLDDKELVFANQLIDYLNLVIERSAQRAGVRYVDVTNAFAGHRLCEGGSFNTAFNGLTFGDDAPLPFGPLGNESFHPNKLGHQLYKQTILQLTNNFTQPMPASNPSAGLPTENSDLAILQAPRSNRPINETVHDDSIAVDEISPGKLLAIDTDSDRHFLEPNTEFSVEIHSEPVELGKFKTDSKGGVHTTVNIPDDLPSGYHSLHIFGRTILGGTIDIYKSVYAPTTAKETTAGPELAKAEMANPAVQGSNTEGPDNSARRAESSSNRGSSILQDSKANLGVMRIHGLPAAVRRNTVIYAAILAAGVCCFSYVCKRRKLQ